MHIKNWPQDERPREKLARHGSQYLSDAELIAVLFGTGTSKQDVMTWSRHLLSEANGLANLLAMSPAQRQQLYGVGTARCMKLQVIMELAKRSMATSLQRKEGFSNPQMVRDYLTCQLSHQQREVFAILLLDSQNRLRHYEEVFFGTINAAPVYPREIVKLVLEKNAASIILAHNHPSGIAEPSQADILVTERIKDSLSTIDVRVLDHFVVGAGEIVSFAERGLL